MAKYCPDCGEPLSRPEKCPCGWEEKEIARTAPKKRCIRPDCISADIYKLTSTGWLCYEHTAKQHRAFVHNMHDYKLEHRQCSTKEAWLYAMQYEPESERLSEEYFDVMQKGGGTFQYNEQELLSQVSIPEQP